MDGSTNTTAADAPDASVYHVGKDTLRVCRRALHGGTRGKLLACMRAALPPERQGVVLLQGGGPWTVYSTDAEGIFRQESYCQYLFGVEEENYYGALDLRSGQAYLFMPRLPDSYAVWMGHIEKPDAVQKRYAVDAVHYVDEMRQVLQDLQPPCLHLLDGENTDSGLRTKPAQFDGMEAFQLERDSLFDVLTECRVRKTPQEVAVLQYANDVASRAHVEVMRQCQPGMMEYELESLFRHRCYADGGCRNAPYTPICASGPNGAILHYGHAGAPNNRQVQAGDMMLMDMGCEYYRYGSDITASFPAGGQFSADQRMVYEAVLAAQRAVLAAMRPGVRWPDMHLLAERAILGGLLAGGWLTGDLGAMLEARVGALFMPHGLGHLLGIDTHDVGGYAPGTPARPDLPGLRHLRTARVLAEGIVITVEPGCYFNAFLLGPALGDPAHARFLVRDRILASLGFGGVRIEDNVVVTADGARSLTDVPRSVADVQAVMAGAPWPPLPWQQVVDA